MRALAQQVSTSDLVMALTWPMGCNVAGSKHWMILGLDGSYILTSSMEVTGWVLTPSSLASASESGTRRSIVGTDENANSRRSGKLALRGTIMNVVKM